MQQTAEERAALWEYAEAADCRQTSLIDTIEGKQLDVIATAWSTLPSEVRAAIVAIVQASAPKMAQRASPDRPEQLGKI